MTKNEFNFHSPDKDIKGEKKNKLNIYQDKSKEDTKFIPSLEMPKDDKQRIFTPSLEMPKKKGINKIEPPKLKPNYIPKNKIEQPHLKPNYKPQNKIQPHKFKPNYTPKNKIEPPQLSPNYQPKNKIQLPKLKANNISKNKINVITSFQNIKDEKFNPNQIKDEIRNFNWKNVSNNWVIKYYNKELQLDPTKDPSKDNPLYSNKDWLNIVYNNESWNLNDTQLAIICGLTPPVIGNWRAKFQITTKQTFFQKKLYNDGKRKECGRCHEIKPYIEFELRNDGRIKNPYLRSTCKECKLENKQIYALKNKYKVLKNIYNGKYGDKCAECETKIYKVPVFAFHHPNQNLKKEERIRTYSNWKKTKAKLENENVIPLCKNCHSVKQAIVFDNYKDLILRKNDFEKNFKGIEKQIHKYLKTQLDHQNFDAIRQIKPWIKKRIIIEKLYEGRCIGCGEDKLPSLQFHHKNIKEKIFDKWTDLQYLNLEEIKRTLIEDNVIILCANCHKMVESHQFEKNSIEIIGDQFNQTLREYYKKIKQNIEYFSFKG